MQTQALAGLASLPPAEVLHTVVPMEKTLVASINSQKETVMKDILELLEDKDPEMRFAAVKTLSKPHFVSKVAPKLAQKLYKETDTRMSSSLRILNVKVVKIEIVTAIGGVISDKTALMVSFQWVSTCRIHARTLLMRGGKIFS